MTVCFFTQCIDPVYQLCRIHCDPLPPFVNLISLMHSRHWWAGRCRYSQGHLYPQHPVRCGGASCWHVRRCHYASQYVRLCSSGCTGSQYSHAHVCMAMLDMFLHSALVQSRAVDRSDKRNVREAIYYFGIEAAISLTVSSFVIPNIVQKLSCLVGDTGFILHQPVRGSCLCQGLLLQQSALHRRYRAISGRYQTRAGMCAAALCGSCTRLALLTVQMYGIMVGVRQGCPNSLGHRVACSWSIFYHDWHLRRSICHAGVSPCSQLCL